MNIVVAEEGKGRYQNELAVSNNNPASELFDFSIVSSATSSSFHFINCLSSSPG
ncbi:hypothetical protein MJ585_25135 [Klebsiella pneumoniae]|nr:hypothetical protein MJ585_25135 [Klebsiella pneumoniae]